MPRYAKAHTTMDELRAAIAAHAPGDPDFEYALHQALHNPRVRRDLQKLPRLDPENISSRPNRFFTPGFTAGWDVVNGFTVLWVALGGDADQPIAAVLYLDNHGALRAYIPRDGNFFDHLRMCPYGALWDDLYGDEDPDWPEFDSAEFDALVHFDQAKLRADVARRIQPAT